MMAHYAPFGA